MKEKRKKGSWQKYIGMAFFVLLGAVCGVLMTSYAETQLDAEASLGEILLFFFALLLLLYAAIFVHILLHEAGHLVFGLLSGYRFSSFRLLSFMWVKEGDHIRLRRLTVAGTAGQCLMTPPDPVDGSFPVVLYNLGGSLMNILAGLVFLGLHFALSAVPFLATAMLLFAVTGAILALANGIPMRLGTVDNDGYNAWALTRSDGARHAFWVQMKVNEQVSKGIRLREMPASWFEVPSDEAMQNSMVAALGVFACTRLMDLHRFEEADELMAHLLEIDSGIVGLHRSLMLCDRAYCALLAGNAMPEELNTKEQVKFRKSMRRFPSVLRTEYVLALLEEKDTAKAEAVRAQFEKSTKAYPYPNEVQSERELMALAAQRAGEPTDR